MKMSARNRFEAKVTSVDTGKIGAIVKASAQGSCDFTALITKEAVDELQIKKGDTVTVVVKATEVMIFK